jgi:hypothetical protein
LREREERKRWRGDNLLVSFEEEEEEGRFLGCWPASSVTK